MINKIDAKRLEINDKLDDLSYEIHYLKERLNDLESERDKLIKEDQKLALIQIDRVQSESMTEAILITVGNNVEIDI